VLGGGGSMGGFVWSAVYLNTFRLTNEVIH